MTVFLFLCCLLDAVLVKEMLGQMREFPENDKFHLPDSILETAGVDNFEEMDCKQCLDVFR